MIPKVQPEPYPRLHPPYDFENEGLLDVLDELVPEIAQYVQGAQAFLGEEKAAQRRSPPYVIWNPQDGRPGAAENRRAVDKPFGTLPQVVEALVVGRPSPKETDPVRASFRGTEHLVWALLWSLHKNLPGSHQVLGTRYERRENPGSQGPTTGLSQANWACYVSFAVPLCLRRPAQASQIVEQVKVDPAGVDHTLKG